MTGSASGVTRALVLAAGRGSRLEDDLPKPLFPVLGVSLLARTLFTLEKAGVTDAWVVVGYQRDRVRKAIDELQRLELRVHWIENDRWEEPNGVSVLAAEGELDEPFFLTMCDHVFEAEAVARLGEDVNGLRGVDLLVDRDLRAINDLDDATKVRVAGRRIVDIGKSLSDYQVIDTGLFLASPELFHALRSCGGPSGPSLSDGVRKLAGEGRARAVDGTGLTWQDVDTREDVKAAERKLLSAWPKETDGPVSRMLNRPISKALSRRLVRTGITPNQVSVATLLVSLLSAVLAGVGGYGAWLASGLLFQFASILDGSDGEVAVLTFRQSRRGEWVDTVCDNLSYLAFVVGLIVGVARAGLPPLYFWSGVAGLAAGAVSIGNINLYLLRARSSGSARAVRYGFEEGEEVLSRLLRVVHYLGKRDLFSFLAMALSVVGRLPLALPLFGAGATLLLLPATTKATVSLFLRAEAAPTGSGDEG